MNPAVRRTPYSKPLRVLVADADAGTRARHRRILNLAGCEVIEACDGRDALTKALTRPPAIIIITVELPLIDCQSLCEIFRRDCATRTTPILVLALEPDAMAWEKMRSAGANAVLVKPVTTRAVLQEVWRLTMAERDWLARAPAADASAKRPAPRRRRR